MQDAYERALKAFQRGAFEGRADPATWLYQVITNLAFDRTRRYLRSVRSLRLFPREGSREAEGEQRVALGEMFAVLQTLPEEQRSALVLKELEGFTAAQTAEILGCSEGAVEQRLIRARAALRTRLHHE